MTTGYREFERFHELMRRMGELEDLYETATAEDDRWTANMCLLELEEINKELNEHEEEH